MANNHKVKSNTIIEETFMWTSILRNAKSIANCLKFTDTSPVNSKKLTHVEEAKIIIFYFCTYLSGLL